MGTDRPYHCLSAAAYPSKIRPDLRHLVALLRSSSAHSTAASAVSPAAQSRPAGYSDGSARQVGPLARDQSGAWRQTRPPVGRGHRPRRSGCSRFDPLQSRLSASVSRCAAQVNPGLIGRLRRGRESTDSCYLGAAGLRNLAVIHCSNWQHGPKNCTPEYRSSLPAGPATRRIAPDDRKSGWLFFGIRGN